MSSEYGWTTEYCLSLTRKEIAWRIEKIVNRRNTNIQFEAKIHGMEVNVPKIEVIEETKLTEEQKEVSELARINALNRIAKRFNRG